MRVAQDIVLLVPLNMEDELLAVRFLAGWAYIGEGDANPSC